MQNEYEIGDLVLLEDKEKNIGVITDVQVYGDDLVDVEIRWSDGDQHWCSTEGLKIISKK